MASTDPNHHSKLVGFFIVLGVFLAMVPILLTASYLGRQRLNRRRKHLMDTENLTRPEADYELLTRRRGMRDYVLDYIRPPPKAKLGHREVQGESLSTVRPSHAQFSPTVRDVADVPDITAANATASVPTDLKRYASTATTLTDQRHEQRRLRAESIELAQRSPLPSIMPGRDGYFRTSSDEEAERGRTRAVPPSSFPRSRREPVVSDRLRFADEEFEDVDLGAPRRWEAESIMAGAGRRR